MTADGRRLSQYPDVLDVLVDATEKLVKAQDERDDALDLLQRIRGMHYPVEDEVNGSSYCGEDGSAWPCLTVHILDGGP